MAVKRVRGVGSVPAKIMIVGEAPGPVEAKEGQPFAGPLAKFIVPLVLAMRRTVYITNAVQRPRFSKGRIRKTSREDMLEDLPYLEEDLKEVRPRVIIALGKIASAALFLLGQSRKTISLPHPRHVRIRKNAWNHWLAIVADTSKEVERRFRK